MEEFTTEEQETQSTKIKRWFQDNLRIIISIAIVIAIAGGIYSYSKRAESPSVTEESVSAEKTADTTESTEAEGAVNQGADEKTKSVEPVSKETENAFVESAGKGDGKTHLARRALANYLEKNPDSSLSKEHKIFIEDYLRKTTRSEKGVRVGTTVEFSKDSIQKAIDVSKKLNDKQLRNLQKYSARVSSL